MFHVLYSMGLKSLKEIKNLKGKKVLLRTDLNVPIEKLEVKSQKLKVKVADDFKIRRALPTIEYLLKNKAKVILISHLGRPEGKVNEKLRMKLIYNRFKIYDLRFKKFDYYQESSRFRS